MKFDNVFGCHVSKGHRKRSKKCSTYQIEGANLLPPMMGQSPEDHVTPFIHPFKYTSVDLFGPVSVVIDRQQEKRWVAIFTCVSARAAYLEIVENLSTNAFIFSLRNFVNRRGIPVRIRCENDINFIGAQKELQANEKILDTDRISQERSNNYIEGIFNRTANPSTGGCWKRLNRFVKRLLSHGLKNAIPRIETLGSVLNEAENVINSRQLTDVPITAEDAEPVTLNHFSYRMHQLPSEAAAVR
ncbi:uncharacterized protein LOC119663998 [Teleopsis dalmanni]|uniref:uncharacterized protein LOC119663998 n=1 Tax=Teleopsis dalmanni TaxID=139649 RepID=UPI0018CDA410|nr:uncharacterized protein LOC119663998 [Teleopsis dalmanni]